METSPQAAFSPEARRAALLTGALASISTLTVAFFPMAWVVAAAAIAGFAALLYCSHQLLAGKAEAVILSWILLFPLGYYYASFPREKAIVTFDRVAVPLVLIALCCARQRTGVLGDRLRKAALFWSLFIAAAILSLTKTGGGEGLLTGARLIVDAFILPAILGWYIVRHFPARRLAGLVHGMVCVMCFYSACIGAVELYTGQDLLPLPGSVAFLAGSGESALIRVNGPFGSNNSYALIGMVSLWLLLFLRRELALAGWRRILHRIGFASALAMTILPLFRSVILSLIALGMVYAWIFLRSRRRIAALAAITASLATALIAVSMFLPDLYVERTSDTTNIYSRLAQQRQNFDMFLKNPLLGTGVGNFGRAVPPSTPYSGMFAGIEPADSPHNALAHVLDETGIVGFLPFICATVLLVAAFVSLRKVIPSGRMAWLFAVFIFVTYWSTGMTESIDTSSDLNLWYIFTLTFIYRFALESGAANREPSLVSA